MAEDEEGLGAKVKARMKDYAKQKWENSKQRASDYKDEKIANTKERAQNAKESVKAVPGKAYRATKHTANQVYDAAWQGTKNALNAAPSAVGSGIKTGAKAMFGSSYKIFFWLALGWHLFDALWMGFDRGGAGYGITLAIYTIFAVWAWFIFDHHGFMDSLKALMLYFFISAICIFAPLSRMLFPSAQAVFLGLSIPELLHLILFFVPVWAVYIGSSFQYGGMKLLRFIWFFAIVGTLIFFIFSSNAWEDLPGAPASKVPLGKFTDRIAEGLSGFIESLRKLPNQVVTRIHNITIGPTYQAEVEQNRGKQLGVYLESVEAIPRTINVGERVDLRATIIAKSFVNNTKVTNKCRLTNSYFTYPGYTDDRFGKFTLAKYETRIISCFFPGTQTEKINISRPTSIKAEMISTFEFETWGYVTYSFISRELYQNTLSQQKDANKEYGLDKYPEAVYTDGPVKLGLIDPSSPLQLPWSLTDNVENDPLLPDFGITIRNKDPFGRVVNITDIQFIIPKPLTIDETSCLPNVVKFNPVITDDQENNVYTLKDDINFERKTDYITVRCFMHLEKGNEGINTLLQDGGVALATLAVKTKYTYELARSTTIKVNPEDTR